MHCFGTSRLVQFSSVLSLSRVRLFATPCTAASQASLSITNSLIYYIILSNITLPMTSLPMTPGHIITYWKWNPNLESVKKIDRGDKI